MSMNVWVGWVGQKIICGEIHKTSGICKCFMMTWLFSKHSHLLTNMSHESLHTGKTSKPLTYSSPSSATLTAESIHWGTGIQGQGEGDIWQPQRCSVLALGSRGGDMAHWLFWVAAHRTELGLIPADAKMSRAGSLTQPRNHLLSQRMNSLSTAEGRAQEVFCLISAGVSDVFLQSGLFVVLQNSLQHFLLVLSFGLWSKA